MKRLLLGVLLALFAAPASAQFTVFQCWNGTQAFPCGDLLSTSLRVKIIEAPTLTISGTVTVTDGSGALNVIVDSGAITLPTGASTAANQTTIIGHVDGIEGLLGGTLTVNANAGTNLNTSALLTTSAHDAAFGTAGSADTQVMSVQGIASMTPVQVSQATASNLNATVTATNLDVQIGGSDTVTVSATNLDVQIGGSDTVTVTTAQTGSGTATGAIRVELPTNGTGVLATVGTVTNLTNLPNEGQQTAANSISVTPDTDNDSVGATASAVPGEATYVGGSDGTNLVGYYVDPCQREAKTYFPVDIVTATTTEIANQVASEFFYVCSINLVTAGANNVAIVEDDSDTCASPTAGLNGGVTAGEGWNFAANGGIALGDGTATVMKTSTANRYFCIITSAGVQLSGTVAYVSAP